MRGFNRLFVLVTAIALYSTTIFSQQITYNDSWGAHGFSLLEDDGNTIRINYSLAEFYLEDLDLDGEQLKAVKVPGIFLPNDEGAPDLAGSSQYIAILVLYPCNKNGLNVDPFIDIGAVSPHHLIQGDIRGPEYE